MPKHLSFEGTIITVVHVKRAEQVVLYSDYVQDVAGGYR